MNDKRFWGKVFRLTNWFLTEKPQVLQKCEWLAWIIWYSSFNPTDLTWPFGILQKNSKWSGSVNDQVNGRGNLLTWQICDLRKAWSAAKCETLLAKTLLIWLTGFLLKTSSDAEVKLFEVMVWENSLTRQISPPKKVSAAHMEMTWLNDMGNDFEQNLFDVTNFSQKIWNCYWSVDDLNEWYGERFRRKLFNMAIRLPTG